MSYQNIVDHVITLRNTAEAKDRVNQYLESIP